MGKTLSEDNHTADFTVCCETKEFRVHKAEFCARYRIISQNIQISDCLFRSPVFRATILSDMEEAKKGEIFIPETRRLSPASSTPGSWRGPGNRISSR